MLSDLPDELFQGIGALESVPMLPEASGFSVPIVAQICDLCVDAFADFCAVYLRRSGSRPAAFTARDSSYDTLASQPHDPLFEERAYRAGIASLIEEPLLVNGRAIGMMILGIGGARLADADHRTVKTLASILATAVQQAEDLAHHYHVSKRLQKAMLPVRLATGEGLSFDAAYRPASDEAEVGGDWYDAFHLGNGQIGISVGDVTGHGLEAAVAMSEIRRAIRSAASSDISPSKLLNHVDRVAVAEGIGMATAIVGIYDPATCVLRYASAGHPPPVLISPNNRALFLPGGGLLLGIGLDAASQDWTVTLSPGTSCFFYTDGLLEYERDIIAGERELLAALERIASRGCATADALHNEIFRGNVTNTDDCATLALHNDEPTDHSTLHLRYSAVPLAAALAREALRSFIDTTNLSNDRRFDILAATGEAVANAIEHGEHEKGGTFTIDASRGNFGYSISIENYGHWRPFTPREERGRGVPIMRACAQSFEIASTQDSTRVTLAFTR